MSLSVGGLNATLGLVTNKAEWARGEAQINHFRRLALGVGAYFGAKWLGGALVNFNRDMETAKSQIASMMAFAKQTLVTDELQNANILYEQLRQKAMSLPGETEDYVKMLGLITQPLTSAKASLNEMSDFTANAFVLSKGLGEGWAKSARDIREFINFGKIGAVDQFLRTVVRSIPGKKYDANDESRAVFKRMSAEERFRLLQQGINTPTVRSIGEQFGATFTGRLETVRDTLKQTMGKAGEALFGSLKDSMAKFAAWLQANQGRIAEWARKVGEYVNRAFLGLRDFVLWLADNQDVVISVLGAIAGAFVVLGARALWAWMGVAWPMFAGAGLIYLFLQLRKYIGDLGAAFVVLGTAIAGAFALKKLRDWIGGIKQATQATIALAAAQQAAGGSAAGNAINGSGLGFLGPAGASQFPQAVGPAAKTSTGMGWMAGLGAAGTILAATQVLSNMTGGSIPEQLAKMAEGGDADAAAFLSKIYGIDTTAPANQSVTVNQAPVTINVSANDPAAAAEKIKGVMDGRDVEATRIYRNLTGNRGDT